MKQSLILLVLLLLSGNSFAQIKAKTENGKIVILNANKTWEYADSTDNLTCTPPSKPVKITKNVKRLIAHVSVANECLAEDVIVLSYTEGKGNGMYNVCVKGKKIKYRMMGSVFMEADRSPF